MTLSLPDGADHPRRTSPNAPHEPCTRVHASPRHGLRRLSRRWWRRAAKAEPKAHARTASALLTAPAVTVLVDATISEAARIMVEHGVERLPVVDERERLVGLVARRELLQTFLQPDEAIRRAIVKDVIEDSLWLAPQAIDVSVTNGVVTLSGELERRSEKAVALRMTEWVNGVVAVIDELTYTFDDRDVPTVNPAAAGAGESWTRRL
ncbi:CBS domain-containing protein [Streptomyces lunaelactis]|uniref:CBS domain-containing protein n=1 Tax=Streptomyces lunaelactis TaxID=1535768 RepID=UPI00211D8B33|nr:CBS domain-containing protein [Streptomyces lunaelactis]